MNTDWPDWNSLTWAARVELIKKRFAQGKTSLLAKRLGVAVNTIKNWKKGVSTPSRAWEVALRDMYERDSVDNIRLASYALFNSAVVDPIVTVVDNALETGDIVTIQMAVYAIVAKVAAVIKATNHNKNLLVQTSSIIDLPASATVEITDLSPQLAGYIASVRVTQARELSTTFYIALEMKRPGAPITRAAYTLADVALDSIIRRILTFFYGRKFKPKRLYRTGQRSTKHTATRPVQRV